MLPTKNTPMLQPKLHREEISYIKYTYKLQSKTFKPGCPHKVWYTHLVQLSYEKNYITYLYLNSLKGPHVIIISGYNAGLKCWDTYCPPPPLPPQAMLSFDIQTHIYTRETIYLHLSTLYWGGGGDYAQIVPLKITIVATRNSLCSERNSFFKINKRIYISKSCVHLIWNTLSTCTNLQYLKWVLWWVMLN